MFVGCVKTSVSIMFSGNGDLPPKLVGPLSAEAEKRGFRGLWFGETTIRDAGVLSCIALTSTSNVEVGTSIVNVYTRSPGQLAMLGSTLNEVGGGRFVLGIGASTPAIVTGWHGLAYDKPLQRVEETVRLLKLYFSGERFSYTGSYSSPQNARLKVQGAPPIALAALNNRMVGLAARVADRVILNLYPPDLVGDALRVMADANPNSRVRVAVMLYAYVLGESDRGLQAARDLIAFYSSSDAYSKLFARAGFMEQSKKALEAWRLRDRESVRKAITDDMVNKLMVYGDIGTLRRRVKEYHDNGVDDVLIAPCPTGEYLENAEHIIKNYF